MDDTGRIRRPLTPTARRIVFGEPAAGPSELALVSRVDRAHLVMLAEEGLVARAAAATLLIEIERLRAGRFAALDGTEARRGRYLLYEDWLAARLGEGIAGILRTGRSRNDLNATVLLLRLRPPVERLLSETLRLQAILLAGARRHAATVMPGYTHYQPAVPTTYGHHLGGVARALDRDLEALGAAAVGLDTSPLGAGTGHGTAQPINPVRTAALLGFTRPAPHSLDAVASRDVVLRLLAAAAVLGVTVSRLAADLLLWTTAEFAFLELPDELVGSSSAMPQKRNPFLLEHVKGRSARAAGAFVAAATAMHATPFANSVAVGTEGCAGAVEALDAAADSVTLLRLVVAGARPQPAAMLARATAGQITATAWAERLVAEEGLSFREAHRVVGRLLTDADKDDDGGAPANRRSSVAPGGTQERRNGGDGIDPAGVVRAARFGGGPGAPAALDDLRRRRSAAAAALADRVGCWRRAETDLAAAVATLTGPADAPAPAAVPVAAGRPA
ncbi:MAG: argininosuccinate lyase [Actinomycetota bacterium]|nr:argininosuccinate lyase [Actinomycetota bacterium]